MHGIALLQDLAVIMIIAGLVTILFHRFKQPVVLGYIIAGVIIGPYTPPFPLVKDREAIVTLSELGVILLMFSLGLEFSLRKLRQVGVAALIAAGLEILLMAWLGYQIGGLFGWGAMDRIFLGAMLSISSTTIIVNALSNLGKTKERFSQLIFGILIIEDILAIVMIALLSGIAMTGTLSVADVGETVGRLLIFFVAALVLGLLAVPRLLGYVARFKSNEMLLITVLGLCFGFALLAVKLGYSVALGAFMIGAVIGEAREIGRIETLIEPVRDMFSAIFFVTIGLMINPKTLAQYWLPIVVLTVVVVVGKVITCALGTFLAGNDTRTSLRVGMGLAQIGEFSFIIASLGLSLNVTSGFLYPIAVAVSVITTLLTPYLIKSSDGLIAWFDRVAPQRIVRATELYTRWTAELAAQRQPSLAARLGRRWSWQIALNVVLTGAVFVVAAFVGRRPPKWIASLEIDEEWMQAGLWLVAAVIALPIFVAIFRKLQAVGLLIAETRVKDSGNSERTAAVRAIVAQGVSAAGLAALALYVLLLSSALLPSPRILLPLFALLALLTWVFWRTLIRLYAKAQVALAETFAQPSAAHSHETPRPMPLMLRDADLDVVAISEGFAAARKLIRELELRSRTGVSIIAIQRSGSNIINPLPDEELLPGDQVLLLGTKPQLEAAKEMLNKGEESQL
jgi:monovalent cation:H+ antiporter-2, CPA2 family